MIDDSSGRPVISDFHAYFKVERVHVQNEPIAVCNFAAYVEYHNDTYHIQHGDCSSPQYGNRTTIVVSASFSYNFYRLTDLDFTILKAESTDTGTYMITTEWRRKSKCYDVFVLGKSYYVSLSTHTHTYTHTHTHVGAIDIHTGQLRSVKINPCNSQKEIDNFHSKTVQE